MRRLLTIILWLAVTACLAVVIVPRYLDRIYYRGATTTHFDGARFFNPDGDDTSAPPTGGSRSGFFVRYLTGSDGRPAWPDQVPVATSKPAPRVTGDAMVATWIGHATVLVQSAGLNILTDPIYAETAGPFGFGPRRVTRPGVALDDLPKIDLIVVSHNHYDHMDLTTLKRLWARDQPLIVTSLGNDAILRDAGIEVVALDWGGGFQRLSACEGGAQCPTIDVTVTRNHHWGSRWFTDRNRALWSSFVVKLPGGNLFFAGDTGLGDARWADEAAALGPIRLALIPIGAFRFVPGQMGTGSHIGPIDAVEVHRRLGAPRAIPIHWGTFRLSYEARDTPPKLLAAAEKCAGLSGFGETPIGVPQVIAPYAAPPPATPVTREAVVRCLDTPAVRALP